MNGIHGATGWGCMRAALLALALVAGHAGAGTAKGWRQAAWPAHVARIDAAVSEASRIDAGAGSYPEDFRAARGLLERARRPQPLGAVEGAWQVRSFQVNRMGTFAYPWFKARIWRGSTGLRFEKTSGSQRRSGVLLPHGDGRSLVFLGGTTVNADPQVGYSSVRAGGEPAESDTVGRLVRIGPRELLLVLDADREAGRFELYHLRR